MQNQLVCRGCRTRLLFPGGASNVCCALCNTVTSVTPPATNSGAGVELSQLICGGCRRLLLYDRGAATVQCSCCNTVNLARPAQLNCGRCRTTLMYPYGAPSVKCALCQYVTNVGVSNMRVPIPVQRPNGAAHVPPSTSAPKLDAPSQTVVVENPTSVDESGKLVSNVVVGVSTQKK